MAIGGLVNMLNVLGALSAPALHGLIVWAYGPVIYGLYAVGFTVAEVASKLGTLGLDKGLLKSIPAHRLDNNDTALSDCLWTSFLASLIPSSILAVGVFFLADQLAPFFGGPAFRDAIAWLAPAIPLFAVTNVFVGATLGAKLVRYNLLVRGFTQPFLLILFSAAFYFRPNLESLSLAVNLALLMTTLIGAWTVLRVFKLKPGFRIQRELIAFSTPLGISEFFNNITHRAPLMILAFYVSPQEVAAYAACDMLVRAVGGVRNAFDPIISPLFSEALKAKDFQRVRYNLKLTTRWVIALAIPVTFGFIFFGGEILEVIDPQFKSATMILTILTLGYAMNAGLGLNGWILTMAGHSWLIFFNNLISSLTNVGLALILIPKFGILGGALSTSAGVVVLIGLTFIQVAWFNRIQPLSWASARLVMIGGACLVLLTGISPRLPETGLIRVFLGMLLFLLAYVVLWRLLAFEKEEEHLWNKLLKRNS